MVATGERDREKGTSKDGVDEGQTLTGRLRFRREAGKGLVEQNKRHASGHQGPKQTRVRAAFSTSGVEQERQDTPHDTREEPTEGHARHARSGIRRTTEVTRGVQENQSGEEGANVGCSGSDGAGGSGLVTSRRDGRVPVRRRTRLIIVANISHPFSLMAHTGGCVVWWGWIS